MCVFIHIPVMSVILRFLVILCYEYEHPILAQEINASIENKKRRYKMITLQVYQLRNPSGSSRSCKFSREIGLVTFLILYFYATVFQKQLISASSVGGKWVGRFMVGKTTVEMENSHDLKTGDPGMRMA